MKKTQYLTLIAAVVLLAFASCHPTEDPLAHLTDEVVVTTADPTYITGSTAICGAEVTAPEAGLMIQLGVCWSKMENPTVDDNVLKTHKCSEPCSFLLTDLEFNTEYHVRGYVQYGTEYCYGGEKTFTTLDSLAQAASPVTTLPAYDITTNSFSCTFTVEPFGAANWSGGICFSRNPNFTIDDCEGYGLAQVEGETYVVHCNGLSPNTTYYYRAYVGYSGGVNGTVDHFFYGEILSLTTLDIPLEL